MDEEELKRLIDEYELATGERSPMRDVLPKKPDEALKELAPTPVENLQALVPSTEVPQIGPQQEPAPSPELVSEEDIAKLAEEFTPTPEPAKEPDLIGPREMQGPPEPPSLFARATSAVTQLPPVRALAGFTTQTVPSAAETLNELAKGVTQEAQLATQGEEFDPSKPFQAAQLAVNPMAALSILAGEKGIPAIRQTIQGGEPSIAEYQPFRFTTEAYAKPDKPEFPTAGYGESQESWLGRVEQYKQELKAWETQSVVVKPEEQGPKMPPGLAPGAFRILKTIGGPQPISNGEATMLGAMIVGSLGTAVAPLVLPYLRFGRTPKMRTVRDAAPGTMEMTTWGDYARTMDDVNKGLVNYMRRAGLPPAELADIEDAWRMQGRHQARSLADAAVQNGRFTTPSFRFQAPTSLAELERTRTPQTDQYLILKDTEDQLKVMARTKQFRVTRANPNPGPPTIDGMTLPDVQQAARAIEQTNPEVVDYAKLYNGFRKAVWDFESSGAYPSMARKWQTMNPNTDERSYQYLVARRPNEVPFRGERSEQIPLAQREGPVSSLAAYTRKAVQNQLNNELVGMTVNAIKRTNPTLMTEVDAKTLAANTHWEPQTVSYKRNGERVIHTTSPFLADVLRTDPIVFQGPVATLMYGTKNLLEFGSTRYGAPHFAPINAFRNWMIGKFTAESGRSSPGIIRSLYAIPQQLLPQMAQAFHRGITVGSGQWIPRTFPILQVDALANRLGQAATDSLYYQLKQYGAHGGGTYLDPNKVTVQARTAIKQADTWFARAKQVPPELKAAWTAYKSILESIHGAGGHAYVAKNLGRAPMGNLALEARRAFGDPRTQGQYFVRGRPGEPGGGGGRLRAIRGPQSNTIFNQAITPLMRTYGFSLATLAEAAPWFNQTLQGAKRIGEAYIRNPIKFTTRMWMYAGLPAAFEYLYALNNGNDPNGVPYVDHLMNRRTMYNRQMNWYIPKIGEPAENGWEIPHFHELAPFRRLTSIAMDQMLRTQKHRFDPTLQDELWRAMWAFVDTAIVPPMPPIMAAGFASQGMNPPQGIWGGEAYKTRNDPFDQTAGLPSSIETMARTLTGGIGHTLGQMYAAYSQTPEGFWNALHNSAAAGVRVNVQKTPILRDVTGIYPPLSGNTALAKETFEKQQSINRLTKFIEDWSLGGKTRGPGEVSIEPASKGGGQAMDWLHQNPDLFSKGQITSPQSPGLAQPTPTNPLYNQFLEEVRARFRKESPLPNKQGEDEGGIGFKSMWRDYGNATKMLTRLRNINEGNYITWQQELDRNPEARQDLTNAGIDTTNIRQVRNFYERKRYESLRTINYTIRAVEYDLTQQLANNPQLAAQLGWDGQPITLEKLDPYKKPVSLQWLQGVMDPTAFIFPELTQNNPQ